MNEFKLKLLNYISENYETVVKPAEGGEYIEIDMIPNSHDGKHELIEVLDFFRENDIDGLMFTRSYPMEVGDGIRMGRYMYFMQKTTNKILKDLEKLNKEPRNSSKPSNDLGK